MMKRFLPMMLLFVLASSILTSCELIEGIFKAGVWVGVIVVVAIIALILWLISKFSGGNDAD